MNFIVILTFLVIPVPGSYHHATSVSYTLPTLEACMKSIEKFEGKENEYPSKLIEGHCVDGSTGEPKFDYYYRPEGR